MLEMQRCYSRKTNRSTGIVPVQVDYVNTGCFFVAFSDGFHLQLIGMSCILGPRQL